MVEVMGIQNGFQKTEFGIIPSDWMPSTVGDLIRFEGGSQPPLSTFSNIQHKYFIRLLQIRDYKTDKYLIFIPEKLARKKCTVDDIMIGRYGPPIFQILTGLDGAYNVALIKAIPCKDLKPEYALQFLKQKALLYFIEKLSQRSGGQTGIDIQELKRYSFPLPPTKTEQTAIATALNDADALITQLEKLITKKRNIKQGAMQELLKPKEGWEVKKLGEVLKSLQLGGNYPNSEKNTAYPLIKMGNIQRGYISTKKIEYIIENNKPEKKDRLKYGDVLFNTRNTLELVGKVSIWRDELPEAYFNSNLMRMEFNPDLISSNFFMNHILNTQYSIAKLKNIATGTTSVAAIYTRDLLNIEIDLPKPEEQTHIAQILSDIDAEIEALEKKLEKYKMIKQGMMQNLLTGRIRLV